jgi:hypothetical protein
MAGRTILAREFAIVASIAFTFGVAIGAVAIASELRKPFHIDARTNPAIITFDNGCIIRIFNGATPSDSPTFATSGPCNDWEWLRRWR